jgi:hypothetical protein
VPLDRIDPVDADRSVAPVAPALLTPVERELERERREQARKRRQKAQQQASEGGVSDDGHLDLLA